MLVVEPVCSVKHALKNTQNDCHQWLSDSSRVHQIRFRPGLRPGPRWGSSRRSPRPPSRLGRGTPPPHSHPLDAFGVSVSRLRRSVVDSPAVLIFPQCLGVWIKHWIRNFYSKSCILCFKPLCLVVWCMRYQRGVLYWMLNWCIK